MRSILLVSTVLVFAACEGDGTAVGGPSKVQTAPAMAPARVVRIAVDDAVDRLLPGLAGDAAGSIGNALRQLSGRVREPGASAAALRADIAHARQTVASFRTPGRPDAATLDAISLELAVEP